MATFRDRLLLVIGNVPFSRWAKEHDLQPSSLEEWLVKWRTPRESSLRKLAEKTGIDVAWWKNGEGAPPTLYLAECKTTGGNAAEKAAPYQGKAGGVDAQLLQQVIDLFYAWIDEHADSVRIDRAKHGAAIALLYRMAEQRGKVEKSDVAQVLRLAVISL